VNDSSVTVNLSAGEAILCTFTNGIEVTNQLPTVLNDVYSTNEGTQLDVTVPGVLGNDSDADGDGLTAVLVDDTINVILTLNADGSFSYLPNPGFTGDDSFTYVANDGMGDSELATVTITVEMPANGPTCQGIPATIVGTDGHDFLTGTSGDDVIVGLNGNDIIRGKGGNDLICGDAGEDWLIGGSGQDKVYGGDGWDTLLGNAGDDELYGESGTDWLDGGLGADWLDGGLNDDVCHGGAHTDTAVNCEAVYSIP
jgi:Ca2+-binding RTX toxin-like protein